MSGRDSDCHGGNMDITGGCTIKRDRAFTFQYFAWECAYRDQCIKTFNRSAALCMSLASLNKRTESWNRKFSIPFQMRR